MRIEKYIYILCASACLISFSSTAQFTYFDVGISQSSVVFSGKRTLLFGEFTKLNTTQIHAGGLWRFNRFFGVGLDVGIPLAHQSKYTLKYATAAFPSYKNNGDYFTNYTQDRYKPEKFDYTFKQSAQFGFVGRIFVGGVSNFFVDVKVTGLKLKENFVFQRAAKAEIYSQYNDESRPALKAENIRENNDHLIIIPGLAIGWQPHLGERFFINFNLAYDFYIMGEERFSYWVPYSTETDYSANYTATYSVKLASQLTGNKLAITGTVRFGMFF